jgi:hypothetical protein
MCDRTDATKELREACLNLAQACAAGVDVSFLMVDTTAFLPVSDEDFDELIAKLDQQSGGTPLADSRDGRRGREEA